MDSHERSKSTSFDTCRPSNSSASHEYVVFLATRFFFFFFFFFDESGVGECDLFYNLLTCSFFFLFFLVCEWVIIGESVVEKYCDGWVAVEGD